MALPRTRLAFIDGLRGLAALYVVLHHAYFEVAWNGGGLSPAILHLTQWMAHGTFAVDVFIVLSGFCLMLPLLSNPSRELAGGVGGFIRRRARRILPPYYAALALCLLLIAGVPALQTRSGDLWDHALPAFTPAVLLSHLLLVHNLSIHWIWRIDNPAWSIATEWQIYLVFALVLVPVWRRLGMPVAVALALVLGNLIEYAMPASNEACFYFIGLFGFGLSAAALYVAPRSLAWVAWNLLASGLCGMVGLAMFIFPEWTHRPKIEVDLVIGLTAAVSLVALARSTLTPRPGWVVRLLESAPLIKLGEFSYSLYLVHFPIIAWVHIVLRDRGISAGWRLVLMLGVAAPLAVVFGYAFHLVFERPVLLTGGAGENAGHGKGVSTSAVRIASGQVGALNKPEKQPAV